MIGDPLVLEPRHREAGLRLRKALAPFVGEKPQRVVVAIAGESGSGKSVTAVSLREAFAQAGIRAMVLHQDDYFLRPPHTNHAFRLSEADAIGPHEVNLDLLQSHLDAFLHGSSHVQAPLVDFARDRIGHQTLAFSGMEVLIVEGTYVSLLERICARVFMARTYLDTVDQRKARGRDQGDPRIESFLRREHELIAPMRERADIVMDHDYLPHLA